MKPQDFYVGQRVCNTDYPQNGEGTITALVSNNDGLEVEWDREDMKAMGINGKVQHCPCPPAVDNIAPVSPPSVFRKIFLLWQQWEQPWLSLN
jgi:hypothetical protein